MQAPPGDQQLTMVITGGSVLTGTKVPLDDLGPAAIDELQVQVPFLFKVLSTAACNITNDNKQMFIVVVYGILMRQRNQRMNALQKAITSLSVLTVPRRYYF